jgi:hypothetical protein
VIARLRLKSAFPTWRTWLQAAGFPDVNGEPGLQINDSAAAYQAVISGSGVALGRTTLAAERTAIPELWRSRIGSALKRKRMERMSAGGHAPDQLRGPDDARSWGRSEVADRLPKTNFATLSSQKQTSARTICLSLGVTFFVVAGSNPIHSLLSATTRRSILLIRSERSASAALIAAIVCCKVLIFDPRDTIPPSTTAIDPIATT